VAKTVLDNIPLDKAHFATRADRARYIAQRFSGRLSGRLLDVGCDRKFLRALAPECDYVGLDVAGDPDRTLDLEKVARLPFDDASFDCVVCADVLEHLDNLHAVFAELVRVCRTWLIVSLPNNWANARLRIARGTGAFAHYGLPVEPPADRHKWFFSLSEALNFLRSRVDIYPVALEELRVTEKPRPLALTALRRLVWPSKERYLNRYAHTLWAVFRKVQDEAGPSREAPGGKT